MNKLIPELADNKLKVYNYQRIIIENYQDVKELTNELIIVDRYNIFGKNLKVMILNQFMIEIYGDIEQIRFE